MVVRQLDDDHARIEATLKPGDRIVALGAHLLSEGATVRVAAATAAGAQP